MHAGTNDANGFPNPEQMGERLTALLDTTVSQWPDAVFLVAQIIPSTNPGTQANIDTLNAQIPGECTHLLHRLRLQSLSSFAVIQ